jgi:isopentenyldiphosphate isomerase
MSGELIDVFDELGRHQGVRDRATVHAEGWWHQVFHLLIVTERNGGSVVLQRRADTKVAFPGLLDLSATGHLAAGEQPVEGLRELREELGVEVATTALHPLGVRRLVDHTPEGVNRELSHVFLVRDDRPLTDYRPDPSEVSAVVELGIDEGLDLFTRHRPDIEAIEVAVGGAAAPVRVDLGAFVPEPPLFDVATGAATAHGYWVTLLVMAGRLLAGDDRLGI